MPTPDFSKIWATNAPVAPYPFTDAEYLQGWAFVGTTPPARTMFDAFMKKTDEKNKWLYDNALYQDTIAPYLNWRMPSTAYTVGTLKRLKLSALNVIVECITAGTTDATELNDLPAGVDIGDTFTDGTVTWKAEKIADMSALQGKANVDLSNVDNNIDYVVDSYSDNSGNWYRVYKSGWVEQGGNNNTSNLSLLKPFANNTYTVLFNGRYSNGSGSCCETYAHGKTATNITVYTHWTADGSSALNTLNYYWYAFGQGATE